MLIPRHNWQELTHDPAKQKNRYKNALTKPSLVLPPTCEVASVCYEAIITSTLLRLVAAALHKTTLQEKIKKTLDGQISSLIALIGTHTKLLFFQLTDSNALLSANWSIASYILVYKPRHTMAHQL